MLFSSRLESSTGSASPSSSQDLSAPALWSIVLSRFLSSAPARRSLIQFSPFLSSISVFSLGFLLSFSFPHSIIVVAGWRASMERSFIPAATCGGCGSDGVVVDGGSGGDEWDDDGED
ncbi:hypothetical protein L6452_24512 [Arctium lappa]|uniref:Uncharacterized protein n=1 Tax=Arctium lappa TaxID=4217 RepID=A0ACB9AAK1_ARCLA|nr:hypothetical protein L6452_24512 [Arctium lappa]